MLSPSKLIQKTVLTLLLSFSTVLFADSTSVNSAIKTTPLIDVKLSTDTVAFGDTLLVECRPAVDSLRLSLQTIPEWQNFSTIRLVSQEESDSLFTIGFVLSGHETCTIPALVFSYPITDTTGDTLSTGDLIVSVSSVLPKDMNESESTGELLKAGKFPHWIWIVSILVVLGFIFRSFFYMLFMRLVGKHKPEEKTVVVIPPYDEAISLLDAFEKEGYLPRGMFKEYTFELSDILKKYVGRRYENHVHESTSTEFRAWIKESGLESTLKALLNRFIDTTDPVKFANLNPGNAVLEGLLSEVKEFVEATNPNPIEEEEALQTTAKEASTNERKSEQTEGGEV